MRGAGVLASQTPACGPLAGVCCRRFDGRRNWHPNCAIRVGRRLPLPPISCTEKLAPLCAKWVGMRSPLSAN